MVVVEPVERIGGEDVRHFLAAEIEDRGVPVRMEALARIKMLVERGAIKISEAVLVGREMRGHPVKDHADPA